MARDRTSTAMAFEQLQPENLLAEAARIKQSAMVRMPDALTQAPIPHEKKYQIFSELREKPLSFVDEGKLPSSLIALNLSDQQKDAIVTEAAQQASVSVTDSQALLMAIIKSRSTLDKGYYNDARSQSRLSFIVALIAAILAVLAFTGAVLALILTGSALSGVSIISTIGGALAALVSGVNFYLYGMTSTQFAAFHARLDRILRFSMAWMMCDLLGPEKSSAETVRDKALATVIANLASASLADSPTYITPLAPPTAPGGPTQAGK